MHRQQTMVQGPLISDFPAVAVLARRGKIYEASSAFGEEKSVYVGRKALNGAQTGDLVLLRRAGRGSGQVTRVLGKSSSLESVMEAVLAWLGVPRRFSPAALGQAEDAARLAGVEDKGRRDLSGLEAITIDPDQAKDFDDAISLVEGPEEDEVTLFVHIADVSYFVVAGTALDREAARKGVSVYLPVAVEPLLPEVLSNDVCSLRPGAGRKCVTAELVYRLENGPGEAGPEAAPVLKNASFYRSLIRSRARLTYNMVDDFFGEAGGGSPAVKGIFAWSAPRQEAGGDGSAIPDGARELLSRCRSLAGLLRQARHKRGALAISTFEPEFRLSDSGEIIGARPRPQSESHALVEEFMIAANEAVARFLERRRSDCIYRVHEEPDAAAVDALFDTLADLGVPTPPFSLKAGTPDKAAAAIRKLLGSLPQALSRKQQGRSAFGELVLRSLKQARYLEDNLGHFGLAAPAYLHFTSPIRRYPDLVVHRALLKELRLEKYSCSRLKLTEIAEKCSQAERRAAAAEHLGDDIALARLLDKYLFEEGWDARFDGEITGVISSGVFVRFGNIYEGHLPARSLPGDYFALSDKGGSLVGRRRGRAWRLGDRIGVRVVRIDGLRGKIELEKG